MAHQKNLYFRDVVKRANKFKEFILNLFLNISSYPRLILEVFLRSDMGERYFSLATSITIAVILFIFPYASSNLFSFIDAHSYGGYGNHGSGYANFFAKYGTWYIFSILFISFSFIRWQEVKKNPSVFDFARFSLHAGNVHPFFLSFKIMGKTVNIRNIEIFLEPGLFLLIGIILSFFGQSVGTLLIVCSIFYSLSYMGAYKLGDDFVMDIIDETLMNEQLEAAFVNDLDASQTKGVRFYAEKPTSEELRRKVGDSFFEDNDDVAVAV